MKKENVKLYGVDDDLIIYQYMDLDYIIRLLDTKMYYVKPKCNFSDKNECTLPITKNAFKIFPADYEPTKKEIGNGMSDIWNEYKKYRFLNTACWTSQEESYLMWKEYTSKIGCFIKTSVGSFINSLQTDEYEVWCGKIKYNDYANRKDLNDLIFSKSRIYESEREIRFIFIDNCSQDRQEIIQKNPRPININVDINTMIKEIVLSPLIEKRTANIIARTLSCKYNVRVCISKYYAE